MDIDINAAPLGDAEHDIEMLLDIAVEASGIETADHVAAEVESRVAADSACRACEDAALREGDELDVDQVALYSSRTREDGLQRFQADRAVDHHVAAHRGGAVDDAKVELVACALVHRRGLGHVVGLEGDALLHVEAVGAWH